MNVLPMDGSLFFSLLICETKVNFVQKEENFRVCTQIFVGKFPFPVELFFSCTGLGSLALAAYSL